LSLRAPMSGCRRARQPDDRRARRLV